MFVFLNLQPLSSINEQFLREFLKLWKLLWMVASKETSVMECFC